jgi:hypothetical protein
MREITVKDFNEVIDGLKQKGYDTDSMTILVASRPEGHYYEDEVWGIQVPDKFQILLEI